MPTLQRCLVLLQAAVGMDAVIDEILRVKLFSEFNRPRLRISSNACFAIALFCSCKVKPDS